MKKEKLGRVDVKRKSLRQSLMEWKDSLHWDKPQNVMLAVTLFVLVSAFLIFNNLSVSYARHWDIEWGYYSILLTFLLLVAGVVVNAPFIAKHFRGFMPSGKSFCGLALLLIVFSVFIFGNILTVPCESFLPLNNPTSCTFGFFYSF